MSDEPHVLPLRVYFAVFLALVAGTALTTWVASLDLGFLNDAVALGIAGTKAVLVALYFMHVRYSARLIWVFSIAGIVWLLIFIVLIMADYDMRVPVQGWTG